MKIRLLPETFEFIKLTDEEYFSDKYKEYISNSKLGLYNPDEDGSYEKFLKGFKEDYNESYELGSAVHAIYLQPDEYEISKSVQKPRGKLGVFAEEFYKLYKESGEEDLKKFASNDEMLNLASKKADYYSNSFTENRRRKAYYDSMFYWEEREKLDKEEHTKEQIHLSTVMNYKVKESLNSLFGNVEIKKAFFNNNEFEEEKVYNEYAIFVTAEVSFHDKVVNVPLKAKFDNIKLDVANNILYVNDLKTTGRPAEYFMSRTMKYPAEEVYYEGSFDKFHYYRQVGMYSFLAKAYFLSQGYKNLELKSNIAVVETFNEFKSILYPIQDADIVRGMNEFKHLLINLVNEQG